MSLRLGDALEWLRGLPDRSVDLVITDPPYDSLERHRAHSSSPGSTCRLAKSRQSSSEWFGVVSWGYLRGVLAECARLLRPTRHAYVMVDHVGLFPLRDAWPDGWQWHKPVVWDKRTIGMGYHYRARYEFIVFGSAGKGASRRLTNMAIPDVIEVPCLRAGRGPAYYPTEKPVKLMEILVSQSAVAGDVVMDPFFGSGSVAVAAERAGCEFWGCDVAPAAHEYLRARMEREAKQVNLFDGGDK